MPSWHCIRAWEPVRLKFRQPKKVAHCNWCSNLSKGSRANTRPGHVAAQSQRREASKRPDEIGFLQFGRCVRFQRKCRIEPGLIVVELWAGSGGRLGDWFLLKGRCGFSALARLRIDYAVLFVSFL